MRQEDIIDIRIRRLLLQVYCKAVETENVLDSNELNLSKSFLNLLRRLLWNLRVLIEQILLFYRKKHNFLVEESIATGEVTMLIVNQMYSLFPQSRHGIYTYYQSIFIFRDLNLENLHWNERRYWFVWVFPQSWADSSRPWPKAKEPRWKSQGLGTPALSLFFNQSSVILNYWNQNT